MEGGSSVDDDLLKLKTDLLAGSTSLPSGRSQAPRAFESISNFQAQAKSNNNVDIVWP